MSPIRQFMSDYIAEVVFLLFKIGESMLEPSVRLYLYEGVCLSLYGKQNLTEKCTGQSIATAAEDFQTRESLLQAEASRYMIANKFLMYLPALFLGFFCGSWSDMIGRRIPVLMTLVATAAAVLLYALSMFVDATGRGVPAISLVLVGSLIRGAVGRSAVITMALYSLVCDRSTRQNRTKKIGRLLSMSYFGYFVGSLVAGALMEIYGFDIVFALVFLLDVVCIALVILFMEKEEGRPPSISEGEEDGVTDNLRNGEVKTGAQVGQSQLEQHRSTLAKWWARMMPFRWTHLVNSIQVLTRERHHRTRLHMFVFLFAIFVHQTCKSGETAATLLFAEAAPLSWRKSMYGYLMATDYALLGISVLVLLPLLIRFFKLSDISLIMTGMLFRVARLFALAVSKSTFEVFFSTLIGCPSALLVSCLKATVSKMVSDNERGKIFALMSCAETVAILVGSVIFSGVYNSTRETYPGMVFILEAVFFLLFLVVIWLVGQDMKRAAQYEEMKEQIPVDNLEDQKHSDLTGREDDLKIHPQVPGNSFFSEPAAAASVTTTNKNPFRNDDSEIQQPQSLERSELNGNDRLVQASWGR